MLALLPGLGSSGSPSSGSNKTSSGTSGSSGSKNATAEDLVLTTTVAYGDSVVACKVGGRPAVTCPPVVGAALRQWRCGTPGLPPILRYRCWHAR